MVAWFRRDVRTRARHVVLACVVVLPACRLFTGPGDRSPFLNEAWHTRLPSGSLSWWVDGRPAVADGRLYGQDGNLALALDAATGRILWSRPIRHAAAPPPTALLARDGRVYISETDSVLALDGTTGRTLWNFRPDSQAVVVPATDATALYTGQRGLPVVYAIALADGRLRWRTNPGADYRFAAYVEGLTVSGDTVYAAITRTHNLGGGFQSAVLVALDRRDGRELWRWESPGTTTKPWREPVVAGRFVLIGDVYTGHVYAIDPATQQMAWRYGPAVAPSRIVVDGGTAYIPGSNGVTVALDVETGRGRWQRSGYGGAFGGGYCAGSFFTAEGRVVRFDAATGRATGRFDIYYDASVVSDIATDGRYAYVTATDGAYAIPCR